MTDRKVAKAVANGFQDPVQNYVSRPGIFGVRHVQAVILFFCLVTNYMMRVNLSMAMVLMTDKESNSTFEVFDWTSSQKGTLFSSLFWGYLVMNFSGAVLITKYNNKTLLMCSTLYSSLVTILTPLLVHWGGYVMLLLIRLSLGLMQGFSVPIASAQISRWIPENERARCGALILGGINFGTIVSFISSGFLGGSTWGWPGIFYVSGGLSLFWAVIWFFWGSESPLTCGFISDKEKDYLKNAIQTSNSKEKKIPWKEMAKNLPCYAVAIVFATHHWGLWMLLTQMPAYFNSVMHFTTDQNGLISALPFVCQWLISFPASYVSDMLIKRGVTTITTSRKIFNSIAHCGACITLIVLGFTNERTTAIAVYTIGATLLAFSFMGCLINPVDVSQNFAGMLMGIANGTGTIGSMASPVFVGYVVSDMENIQSWRIVFLVTAGIFFVGNLIFLTIGSGQVQEFDKLADEKTDRETEVEGYISTRI